MQDKYNAPFPTNLRTLLDERKVTITALSRELGITRQAVSQYADGTGQPNADKLKRIADYFNVSTDWLLGRSGGVKSLDADVVKVGRYTGLSEPIINWLHCEEKEEIDILNLLLSHCNFRRLIEDIAELKSLIQQARSKFQDTVDNLESDDPDFLDKKIVAQYSELAQQIGGLHIVNDFEYFHMREYNIDKELSDIVEAVLYCDTDDAIRDMKDLIFDFYS